jgi:hypothetical protein
MKRSLPEFEPWTRVACENKLRNWLNSFLGGADRQNVVKESTAQLSVGAKCLTSFSLACKEACSAIDRTSRAKQKR